MAKKISRFVEVCPRKLKGIPSVPCPSALLRIEFIQSGKREGPDLPGCPYYVNDVMANYCWFNYAGQTCFGNHSTKEISQILSLTSAQVEKAERSAIDKIIRNNTPEELAELREYLADMSRGDIDETIYAIGSFTTEIIEELGMIFGSAGEEEDASIESKGKRGRRSHSPKGSPSKKAR